MLKFLCTLFLMMGAVGAQAEFFGETDIPLMEDMQINESESFSFDVPAGQITGFAAISQKSVREVMEFYQASLEELGWQQKEPFHYSRDQDELVLQIKPGKQGTIVKIQYSLPNR